MLNHTPGPWRSKEGLVYDEANGDTVAIMGGNVDGSPCANARLIATAPELLAALEMVLDADGDLYAIDFDMIRNTVAKAKLT